LALVNICSIGKQNSRTADTLSVYNFVVLGDDALGNIVLLLNLHFWICRGDPFLINRGDFQTTGLNRLFVLQDAKESPLKG